LNVDYLLVSPVVRPGGSWPYSTYSRPFARVCILNTRLRAVWLLSIYTSTGVLERLKQAVRGSAQWHLVASNIG
jgi:hypothetical protein